MACARGFAGSDARWPQAFFGPRGADRVVGHEHLAAARRNPRYVGTRGGICTEIDRSQDNKGRELRSRNNFDESPLRGNPRCCPPV